MQIEERLIGNVMILDLKGKLTIGEGDELLKDKVNSLIQQGHKKLLPNLEGVPYVDSAGLGEIVRTYTTVSRQGGQLQAPAPDEADRGLAGHHEIADGVRHVRVGTRRAEQLLLSSDSSPATGPKMLVVAGLTSPRALKVGHAWARRHVRVQYPF